MIAPLRPLGVFAEAEKRCPQRRTNLVFSMLSCVSHLPRLNRGIIDLPVIDLSWAGPVPLVAAAQKVVHTWCPTKCCKQTRLFSGNTHHRLFRTQSHQEGIQTQECAACSLLLKICEIRSSASSATEAARPFTLKKATLRDVGLKALCLST